MAKKTSPSVQYAQAYEGCQVLANIMGLNVETVRRRAKAGKIPGKQQGVKGTWLFVHNELVVAGIEPFAAQGPIAVSGQTLATALHPPKQNFTDVIFVLDRSGSMQGLEHKVRESLREQVGELNKGAGPNDHYAVSVINFDEVVSVTLQRAPVQSLAQAYAGGLYLEPNGATALFDAISHAISLTVGSDNGQRAFLISVLTDGMENASKKSTAHTLAASIRELTATGRYTFTYAGPRGSSGVAVSLGIPEGNCTTWDPTVEGYATLSSTTKGALGMYTNSRSAGVMRSESFYAQPVIPDASKFAAQVSRQLDDVTDRVQVERVTAADPLKISDFAKRKFGSFKKGELYYELTESEKVQDYKSIVIQDKTKGRFFSGWDSAKQLLGLPDFRGTVNVRPGDFGDFKVFVQSTSVNRRLDPGTAIVKLDA